VGLNPEDLYNTNTGTVAAGGGAGDPSKIMLRKRSSATLPATTKAEETVVFTPTLRDLPPAGPSCPAGAASPLNLGVAALTVGGCTGGQTIRDLFPPPATGGTLTGGEDCNRLSGTAQSMCVRRQLEHLPTGYTPPLQPPAACPGAPTWANTTCNNLGLLGGYNIHINANDGGSGQSSEGGEGEVRRGDLKRVPDSVVSTEVGEDVHDFKETYVGTDGRFYDVYTGPDGQFYLVSHDGKVVVPTGEYRS
jgi:hypothetical protein